MSDETQTVGPFPVTPEQKEIFKNDISIFQEFVSAKIFEHNLIHYCNLDLTPASEG